MGQASAGPFSEQTNPGQRTPARCRTAIRFRSHERRRAPAPACQPVPDQLFTALHTVHNPAIALLTFQGAPSDALLAALGEHPPANDPAALQQQLTLYGAEPYYQLGLRIALVERGDALPSAARVAIEARLDASGIAS